MIVLSTFAGLKATYNVLNLKITKKKKKSGKVLLYIPAHLHHTSKHARRCVLQRTACVFAVAFCTIHSIRLLHTSVTPSTPYTILIKESTSKKPLGVVIESQLLFKMYEPAPHTNIKKY